MPQRNLAVELLQRLLRDEIRDRGGKNVVQARSFAEMLQKSMNAYHNRALATQEIIEELIRLAKELREASRRGEDLGLSDDEIAFYDALAMNESAVQVMGVDELKVIAVELVTKVRQSVTIDWCSGSRPEHGFGFWSAGFCGSTAILPISKRRRLRLYWNRPRRCVRGGQRSDPRPGND